MTIVRGDSEVAGIVALVILGLVIAGVLWIFGFNFGIENEGTAKFDDCRQVITLPSDSWQRYFHKFTCVTRKTKSGTVISRECVSIETANSLFSNNGVCEKAYVYEKKDDTGCTDPKYPYLGFDDQCYTTPQ